jgi:hypothetical protein
MSIETTAILRVILYQLEISKTLDDAKNAVRVMCTKDDITAVEHEVTDYFERQKERGN